MEAGGFSCGAVGVSIRMECEYILFKSQWIKKIC